MYILTDIAEITNVPAFTASLRIAVMDSMQGGRE